MTNLESLKNIDVRTVDRESLVDINTVVIDESLPRPERIRSFLEQIKNPYCYLDGDVVVKISFCDTEATLEDRLEHYIRGL